MARAWPTCCSRARTRASSSEMRLLVEGLPFRVVGPRDLGLHEAPEETGTTFLENATLKALAYARRSGLLTVADDSGLSVDALDGAPGLYSSRFGGEGASDLDRNRLLLEKLRGVPPRAARRALHERGRGGAGRRRALPGRRRASRARSRRRCAGANGFGYDPLFFYPPFGRTFGEVPRAGEGPGEPPRARPSPGCASSWRAGEPAELLSPPSARSRRGPSSGARPAPGCPCRRRP